MTQTSQYQMQQSSRKHSGASTILLPLLQALNSLEVLVFLELWLLKLIILGSDGKIVIF